MPVRLNKVIAELNVALDRIDRFLAKKGKPLTDVSPNAKISDEQYNLLNEEFGKDKSINNTTKENIQKLKDKQRQDKADRKAKQREEEQNRQGIFRTDTGRQKYTPLGNINDFNKAKEETKREAEEQVVNTPKKEEEKVNPTPIVEDKAPETAPEKTAVVEKKTENVNEPEEKPVIVEEKEEIRKEEIVDNEEEKSEEEDFSSDSEKTDGKKNDGIYRVTPTAAPISFKQVGFIDLNTINGKTRPDRKSKAEKKKEREEKGRQMHQGKQAGKNGVQEGDETSKRKKRQRISANGKERVDINAAANQQSGKQGGKVQQSQPKPGGGKPNNNMPSPKQGNAKKSKKKDFSKQDVTDEEVAKQVKDTLARLTQKQQKNAVKYRREKRDAEHRKMQELEEEENAESKILKLTEFVTANELATMMNIPVTDVISTCMSIGIMVSINQRLDAETINLVAEEFGFTTNYVSSEVTNAVEEEEDKEEDLVPRPPIITVMGHVDHGKTSLLDYIRNTNVIAGEAGGITQHIGAYSVKMKNGKKITFLDTPGHEAFTAMRARGAQVTDIAIIIIAADDDVMPQTKEAINHAVAANVPMVFAINKIDKPGANPEKIKEQLANMNYLVEDWGGKYQSQEISAKKGIGVDDLMEKVLLEAEMLELKANPNRKATGSVIESSLDKGRGYVATILVQNGTLKQGDVVLAGTHYGKVKAMFNERGQRIQKAGPAEPALILGLNGAPTAGDTFHVMETEQEAREITSKREQLQREQGIRTQVMLTLDEVGRRIALGSFQELNIIVKGDVDGSIEALSDSLIKLSTEHIQVNVIHKAVGQISESDVSLAEASNAIIIGFQVRPSASARHLAEQEGVDIRLYSIIYDAIEQVKAAMEGMLAPIIKEEDTGTAEVRQVYKISKVGTVAGAFVLNGKIHRSDKIRVIRDGIVVHTGDINALKRFKDDVKEVSTNFDCGISIVNYNDIREGDILEAYTEIEVKQKL
ncbi:MAG: translation initiation factor IF-2 [Bacteroidaceae bacterium]|nr:translation initiation factor IF-2 [Bacteroidaceae bacterium]